MFQRIIDGISASTGTTVRLTSLAAGAAFALFITTCFLCAAAFISVLNKYGPVQACLAGAGVFFLLTLAAAVSYWAYKRELRKQAEIAAERAARSAASSMLADPMLLATGLQIVRAIGVKRLLPILAIGGVALGIMASRAGMSDDVSAEPAE
jgi:ABC-type transport system involved in multi-copper enzyme maturation permease subunit